MAQTSTFHYLVDDFNLPSDMLLSIQFEPIENDEELLLSCLNDLKIDPGQELVNKIMNKIRV